MTRAGTMHAGGVLESAAYNPTLPPLQGALVAAAADGVAKWYARTGGNISDYETVDPRATHYLSLSPNASNSATLLPRCTPAGPTSLRQSSSRGKTPWCHKRESCAPPAEIQPSRCYRPPPNVGLGSALLHATADARPPAEPTSLPPRGADPAPCASALLSWRRRSLCWRRSPRARG